MASKADIKKGIVRLKQAAEYCLKLASDLEEMTEVSTPVLKRKTSTVRMEMRAFLNSKYKNKKAAALKTQTA